MPKKAKYQVDDPIKMLIYSPPGHGKTTLLGTAAGDARLSPMLLMDFEAGTRSIASRQERITLEQLATHVPSVERITTIRVLNWEDFDTIHDYLKYEEHQYRSVALDSLSEVNYLNLTEVIDDAARRDSKHDPDVAEQRDYLKSAQQLRRLVRSFRDLPVHVFFTALAQVGKDPISREMLTMPSLVGKLVNDIPGLVEITGYLAVVEEREGKDTRSYRALLTDSSERYYAKDRTEGGKLGGFVENPTLPKLLDLIYGE